MKSSTVPEKTISSVPIVLPDTKPWMERNQISVLSRRISRVGLILGFLPVTNAFSSRDKLEFRPVSVPTLYCTLIVVIFSLLIVEPLGYYLEEAGVEFTKLTDKLTLRCFIASLTYCRLVAPYITILTAGNWIKLIHTFVIYDQTYRIASRLIIVDRHMISLFCGTFLSLGTNWYVSKNKFQEIGIKYSDDPLLSIGTGSEIPMIGHMYGEIVVLFLMASVLFFAKLIENRLIGLKQDLETIPLHCANNMGALFAPSVQGIFQVSMKRLKVPASECGNSLLEIVSTSHQKLKALVNITEIFNGVAGVFIVMIMALNFMMLVSGSYLIIFMVLSALSENVQARKKADLVDYLFGEGIGAIFTALLFAVFRSIVLIEIGRRFEMNGKQLETVITNTDTSLLPYQLVRKIEDMRWIMRNASFRIHVCGLFVLSRELITSVLGSIATFAVVLSQFRMTE